MIDKEEAEESVDKLVLYLRQVLEDTDLKTSRSRAYKMIDRYFTDFKNGKEIIEIDAMPFDSRNKGVFGPTTAGELQEIANIFNYSFKPEVAYVKNGKEYCEKAVFKIKK